MPLTLHLPASVVPAIAPVPYPDAQWHQVYRGSGISAQDPPWSSNKELVPAAASANGRAQTGWFFISPYATPNTTYNSPPGTHSSSHTLIHLSNCLPSHVPLSFTHPLPTYPRLMAHLLFYKMRYGLRPQRVHCLARKSKWWEGWAKEGRAQEPSCWSPDIKV